MSVIVPPWRHWQRNNIVRYLTPQDILVIHAQILDATSGSHGIRDVGLLISLTERPKMQLINKEIYRSIFEKAAVYMESLMNYHVFIDGNKRTALISMMRFLAINGYEFIAPNKVVESFVLKVAVEKMEIEDIGSWIKKYARKKK